MSTKALTKFERSIRRSEELLRVYRNLRAIRLGRGWGRKKRKEFGRMGNQMGYLQNGIRMDRKSPLNIIKSVCWMDYQLRGIRTAISNLKEPTRMAARMDYIPLGMRTDKTDRK